MSGAATFTDSLYLNAQGNPDAVFVIKINGALTTSTYSKVKLINGAQAQNVYWKIEGAVTINNYSTFCGTIICNNAALGAVNTGVTLNGRALTTNGALSTTAINGVASMIPGTCSSITVRAHDVLGDAVSVYPNPFKNSIAVTVNNVLQYQTPELIIYNMVGKNVMNVHLTQERTVLDNVTFSSGMYFYSIISNGKTVQSGKLIAQ